MLPLTLIVNMTLAFFASVQAQLSEVATGAICNEVALQSMTLNSSDATKLVELFCDTHITPFAGTKPAMVVNGTLATYNLDPPLVTDGIAAMFSYTPGDFMTLSEGECISNATHCKRQFGKIVQSCKC